MKQYAALDDTIYFWFAANDTSGSGGDGASPAADVRLAGAASDAAPVYSPTPSLLSHASYPAGAYEIAIAATAANGFAATNTYAVFCTLAIDAQNPTGFVGSFDTKPVESNPTQIGDSAQSLTDLKDFADAGYDPASNKIEGCKVNDDMVGAAPTVTAIRQEMDANSTKMAPSQTLNDYKATGFSTHNAAAVWSVATRILTASTNFNDLTAAEMKAEVVAALADIKLDHLINIAVDTDWATTVHLDSVIGYMADVGTAATFDRTTDALEAIRARGDAAWIAATGFSTHSAADVKTVIEQAGSSLAQILADTNELELDWKNDGRLDLLIDAILLDTGTTLDAMIERILGMNQENFYIDTAVFTGANMTSCRIRIYSVAGSVGGASDVLATYTMTATYSGNNLASYKMVKA